MFIAWDVEGVEVLCHSMVLRCRKSVVFHSMCGEVWKWFHSMCV